MKSLTLHRPIELGQTMVDINRFMESVFGESPFSRSQSGPEGLYPRVDIHETNDAYHIEADLPGCEEKDIELAIDSGVLTIQSKKEFESEKKNDGKNYIIRERQLDVFSRSFKLPDNADSENISATFKNGLLSLNIKKRAEAQKRVISIGK
ncbi:MAG: Hsp20/alpha crystallin family protein [Spirochaetaceae bacterium]|jgi:HSP20 family protein|nr:Hsp20/alpha crystallin family protein [Spirochaetaceae bacterium]